MRSRHILSTISLSIIVASSLITELLIFSCIIAIFEINTFYRSEYIKGINLGGCKMQLQKNIKKSLIIPSIITGVIYSGYIAFCGTKAHYLEFMPFSLNVVVLGVVALLITYLYFVFIFNSLNIVIPSLKNKQNSIKKFFKITGLIIGSVSVSLIFNVAILSHTLLSDNSLNVVVFSLILLFGVLVLFTHSLFNRNKEIDV